MIEHQSKDPDNLEENDLVNEDQVSDIKNENAISLEDDSDDTKEEKNVSLDLKARNKSSISPFSPFETFKKKRAVPNASGPAIINPIKSPM